MSDVEVLPLMGRGDQPSRRPRSVPDSFMKSRTCQVIAVVLFGLFTFYLLGSMEPPQPTGGGAPNLIGDGRNLVETPGDEKGDEVDKETETEVDQEFTKDDEKETEHEGEQGEEKESDKDAEKRQEEAENGDENEEDDEECNVMFMYIGKLPQYIGHTIAQARCWNPTCKIWFAGNKTEIDFFMSNSTVNQGTEVTPVYLEDLTPSEEYWQFYRKKAAHFSGFWLVTSTRVWLMEHVMRKYDLKDVLYIESDNSVYFDFKEKLPTFRKTIPGFSVTPSYSEQSTMSVSFIKDADALLLLNKFSLTRPGGEDDGEMRHLARFYQNETGGAGKIDSVPVCPYGDVEATRHMDDLHMTFDNGAWGIWLGGPHLKWQSEGGLLAKHLCYPAMKAKCCQLEFQEDARGRFFPMVHYRNPDDASVVGEYPLGNIHWHSKNVMYMANSCNATAYEKQPPWTQGGRKFWEGWKTEQNDTDGES